MQRPLIPVAVLVVLCACGERGPTQPRGQVVDVDVFPRTAQVDVGETFQLNAEVNAVGEVAKTVTWSSVTNIARVDSVGVVTGLVGDAPPDTAVITATSAVDPTKKDSAKVAVWAKCVFVLGVSVSPDSMKLYVGQRAAFSGSAERNEDCRIKASREVVWSLSDTTVATIERQTGVVTAQEVGVTTVTAISVASPTKQADAKLVVVER